MSIASLGRPLTVDDLPGLGPWPRYELIDGSLYVTPAPGLPHQGVVEQLQYALHAAAPAGSRVLPGANVVESSSLLVIPDVVVISGARFREGGSSVEPGDLLLAVEVESRTTRRRDRTLKRSLYEEWAVPYLLVDPDEHTVSRFGEIPGWLPELTGIFD